MESPASNADRVIRISKDNALEAAELSASSAYPTKLAFG